MLNYESQYVNSNWPRITLSTSTYPLDQTYNNVCHRCHKQLAAFLLQQKVFCKPGSIRTLFLAEVLCFNMSQLFSLNKGLFDSLALTGCFSLLRFMILQAPWFSSCGGLWCEPSIYVSLMQPGSKLKLGHKSIQQKLKIYKQGKIPTKVWQDPLVRSVSLAWIKCTA